MSKYTVKGPWITSHKIGLLNRHINPKISAIVYIYPVCKVS